MKQLDENATSCYFLIQWDFETIYLRGYIFPCFCYIFIIYLIRSNIKDQDLIEHSLGNDTKGPKDWFWAFVRERLNIRVWRVINLCECVCVCHDIVNYVYNPLTQIVSLFDYHRPWLIINCSCATYWFIE